MYYLIEYINCEYYIHKLIIYIENAKTESRYQQSINANSY